MRVWNSLIAWVNSGQDITKEVSFSLIGSNAGRGGGEMQTDVVEHIVDHPVDAQVVVFVFVGLCRA